MTKPAVKPTVKPAVKPEAAEESPKNHNLALLGILAVAVALTTTAISVLIYHNSGDIYLDRSRPGFLPDEEEVEASAKEDYTFSENDPLSVDSLEDYLEHYQETLNDLDKLDDPFNAGPLSNESLGIPDDPELENQA